MRIMKFASILIMAVSLMVTTVSASDDVVKKGKVKVWGNCGMCKAKIEKAAKDAGAVNARWDVATHLLSLTYTESKSSLKAIEEKVASVGYDTENVKGSNEAYDQLASCCKYDRKPLLKDEVAN